MVRLRCTCGRFIRGDEKHLLDFGGVIYYQATCRNTKFHAPHNRYLTGFITIEKNKVGLEENT